MKIHPKKVFPEGKKKGLNSRQRFDKLNGPKKRHDQREEESE